MPLMADPSIQHMQIIIGIVIGLAMAGTLVLSLASRWIGGVWTTLLGILAACLIGYRPLIDASLFAGFDRDPLRRILLGMIPFTAIIALLSPRKIPAIARILLALLGPSVVFYWVFSRFDLSVPPATLLFHEVLPVGLAIFAGWVVIEPLAHRSPGAAAPIAIGAVTAGLAALLLLSAENQAGLMAPLIPATAGGAVLASIVAALIRKPIHFARGPVLLWLTLIAALFAFMWLDTEKLPLPWLYWIAGAPLLAWIPEIPVLHRIKPWKRETLRLVLVLTPVTFGVVLAYNQHKKEAAESGDEYSWVTPPRFHLQREGVNSSAPLFSTNRAHPAAPMRPSQMPIPNTINPPTIT
jgi:hypothetical protein